MNRRNILLLASLCILIWIQPVKSQKIAYKYRNVRVGGGGFVTGIITHSACKDLIYARTDVGGAYRWNASDSSWIPLNDDLPGTEWSLQGVESVGIDPVDTNRVYLATGMYTNNWAPINGAIFSSSDKGATWKRTMLPFKNGGNEDGRGVGERLAVDPNNNSILFFGTRKNGLWMSHDYADSWSRVESFPVTSTTKNGVGISFVIFDKATGSKGKATKRIYAGIARKDTANIFVSADGGQSWQPLPNQDYSMMPNHAVLASDGCLYFTFGDGVGPNDVNVGKVMKFDPSLKKWSNITPPTGQGGFAGISVYQRNPKIIAVSTIDRWGAGDEIYLSDNGGVSWKGILQNGILLYTDFPWLKTTKPHWISDVEIDPQNPGRIMFVTGYGLWSSINACRKDPVIWKAELRGLEETVFLELVSPSKGSNLLSVMHDYDGFRHDNPDISPEEGRFSPCIGTTTGLAVASGHPEFVVRTGDEGFYSQDGGSTWTKFGSKPSGAQKGKVSVSADGNTIVWAPESSPAAWSRDKGNTWTNCRGDIPAGLRVIADEQNPQKFYMYERASGKVYISTDGGASFVNTATVTPWGGPVKSVPGREGDIWIPCYDGVWRFLDSGSGFTKMNTVESAEQIGFGKAAPGKNYPSVYLVGKVNGNFGFYRSDDEGATWLRINDDQHRFGGINFITGDPKVFGRFYLATSGRGIICGEPSGK